MLHKQRYTSAIVSNTVDPSNGFVLVSVRLIHSLVFVSISCLPIIQNGRLDYIEDDEGVASGAFRREMLADTQELVYNAIAQFSEHEMR